MVRPAPWRPATNPGNTGCIHGRPSCCCNGGRGRPTVWTWVSLSRTITSSLSQAVAYGAPRFTRQQEGGTANTTSAGYRPRPLIAPVTETDVPVDAFVIAAGEQHGHAPSALIGQRRDDLPSRGRHQHTKFRVVRFLQRKRWFLQERAIPNASATAPLTIACRTDWRSATIAAEHYDHHHARIAESATERAAKRPRPAICSYLSNLEAGWCSGE
jgi:hypothetical protein